MTKIVIIIPSRMASTRLIRKPLINIDNKSMLMWCAEQAKAANIGDVYIACDGDEIAAECTKYQYKYILTDPSILTGSDRVYAAYKTLESCDIIVNLQGDMPKIKPSTIQKTVQALINDVHKNFDIMSAITAFNDDEERQDENNVSAIVCHKNNHSLQENDVVKALYFTRVYQPHSVYKHIGIYAYRQSALEKFITLPQSKLEIEEKLEQLRALENGLNIGCVFVNDHVISIDTISDLARLTNKQ